jgi:hypothetical protein
MSERTLWDVRTEAETVIVELPAGLELTKETGESINKAFAEAVGKPATTRQLTILETDDPLSSGLFEELKKGADLAAENGITQWAVVVDEQIKGMAFESKLDGLETEIFESRATAEDWFDS